MKKIFYITLVLIIGLFIFNYLANKSTVEKVQELHAKTIKKHLFNTKPSLSKAERFAFGLPPNTYLAEKYLLEMNPYTGRTHPENIYNTQQELAKKRAFKRRTPGDAIDNKWEERGPNNVGGRTRMVLFDPNDATHKRVFAGGVSGGLWVNDDITNENSSWIRVGIDENLAVTCMAVDPNDSQIMYIGTGELNAPQQALGDGVWKSIDGGKTWNNIYKLRGTTTSGSVPGTYYITDIVVRDSDGSVLTTNDSEVFVSIGAAFYSSNPINTFVSTNEYGIFKSTDEGANFNRITLTIEGTNVAANDFEIGIDNTLWLSTVRNIYGEGGGQIYSSTDGNSFTLKHTIANGRRTEIAVSKQNANTVYVLARIGTLNVAETAFITPYVSLLKTTDGFATLPTDLTLPNDADTNIPADDFARGQAFYNLVIEVDPTNDAIAYAGGIDLFRSIDSGTNWNQISKWHPGSLAQPYFLDVNLPVPVVHADQHVLVFHPTDANKAILGNDGGVYYATSLSTAAASTTAISERNKNYNVTQFYNGAIGQSVAPDYFIGGSQDNGTQFFNNATEGINSTTGVFGGDGTQCFIDKDGGYMIVTHLYNRILRFDLPYTGSSVTIASDRSTGSFVNAMALDDHLDILYTNGSDHLARFTDITTGTPIRTNITDALLSDITAIKVSPFTLASSKVFAGTKTGKLIKVENADTAIPTITDISSPSFLGSISSVEFGASENEIMVTFYNFGVESIWYTNDGGVNWSNKEGNFPDINVRCILMNPLNNDEVIIGTELGVWNTANFKDTSPVWNQSYNGMSNVAVTSLNLRTIDHTILASTYGRGMYTGNFKIEWTGATSSDWDTASNWETNSVPSTTDNVVIPTGVPHFPTAANDITVSSITIQSGASFKASGTVTGKVTYLRNLPTDNWYLIASPVSGTGNVVSVIDYLQSHDLVRSTATTGVNQNIGLAPYDNTKVNANARWNYYTVGDFDDLNANDTTDEMLSGQGFSTKLASTGSISFTGNMNTENVTRTISSGAGNAFNLVGNPYTSFVDANTFLTTNSITNTNIDGTIWLWNKVTNSYDAENLTGSIKIAPTQGFFVKKAAGSSILFEEGSQTHETTDTFQKTANPEIKLHLSNGINTKFAKIFYINGTSAGFDNGYDSELFGGVSNNFTIYSHLFSDNVGKKYQIQSLPDENLEEMIIPLGVKSAKGEVTFNIDANNLPANYKVFLEDKITGVFTRLDEVDSEYRVVLTSALNGENEIGRFFLHTTSQNILNVKNETLSNILLYSSNKEIKFSRLPKGKTLVTLYNVLGKKVLKETIDENTTSISAKNLQNGIYIIDVKSDKGNISKKILIE
ncbi:T9SS type A sorting domain-containing protein [uncultured Polaribacter sp.]|uniref:T9SS type A sorting domain-containing protein n=1 Tax=uncultured Polaribacter sp. TaxID=174711 RepID=UPI0026125F45|nr:T9SS type A sorting domain-containing protein [uncultured Polaribacter sp.]